MESCWSHPGAHPPRSGKWGSVGEHREIVLLLEGENMDIVDQMGCVS